MNNSPARRILIPQQLILKACLLSLLPACGASFAMSQQTETIYDEEKVPKYVLPELLTTFDGESVTTAEQWFNTRRPELLQTFAEQMFGAAPQKTTPLRFEVIEPATKALDGKAHRKQVTVYFSDDDNGPSMDLLIYSPLDKPSAPAFLTLNFYGNHTISSDPQIKLNPRWMRNNNEKGVVENKATESSRGTSQTRWPVETIIDRGYALITIYYGDIDPDFDDGFQNGVHPLFYEENQTKPSPEQWGSIAAWAWGLSRALDYLQEEELVDEKRVAVMGHSRLGKTSLWAGATDPRFALVISNNSGCGGAALSRRCFGETVERINTAFPHWFCDNFQQYNANESSLPIDQHQLIALIAPRPVYVASAENDRWADPKGEFLSAFHASSVYDLLGKPALTSPQQPETNQPVHTTIGYHVRSGKHDVTEFDWEQYLKFADQHLK